MPTDRLLAELSRYQPGTYADVIVRNALLHGDVDALVSGDTRVTFAEYNARVNRLVRALQALGLAKGDVIGLLSWNCLESFDVLGAAMKGGFIFSPYSPRLRPADLEHLVAYSEARVLFVGPELAPLVQEIRPRLTGVEHVIALEQPQPEAQPAWLFHDDLLAQQPPDEPGVDIGEDDPVYIIYTSGTTGVPRGALYTHARAMHNIQARVAETPVQVGDRSVLTLQLFHVAGMESAQTFLYAGATDVILKTFEPRLLLETIQEHRITDVQVVPTTLARPLQPARLRRLRPEQPAPHRLRRLAHAGRTAAEGHGPLGPHLLPVLRPDRERPHDHHPLTRRARRGVRLPRGAAHPALGRAPLPRRARAHRRRAGRRPPRRRGGRDHRPQQAPDGGVLAPPRGDRPGARPTAGSTRATWPTPTSAATSTSWAARAT